MVQKVRYLNKWYPIILLLLMLWTFVTATLELFNSFRLFSLVHIILVVAVFVASFLSIKYFEVSVKIWATLFMFSGGLILAGLVFVLLSGGTSKVSMEGNIMAMLSFVVGFILIRYFESSVVSATSTDEITEENVS